MRKTFTLCIMMMLAAAVSLHAAESLGFKVMGVEITEDDANDIIAAVKKANPSASIGGKMWYKNYDKVYSDYMSHTLFVEGTVATAKDVAVIEHFDEHNSLHIVFVGKNRWDLDDNGIGISITSPAKTYFSGDTLLIYEAYSWSENTTGIQVDNQYASVEFSFMKDLSAFTDTGFKGHQKTIASFYYSEVWFYAKDAINTMYYFIVENSTLKLNGSANTIANLGSTPILKNCTCKMLTGGDSPTAVEMTYDSSKKTCLFDGKVVTGEGVRFEYTQSSGTGIFMFGTELTEGADQKLYSHEGTYTLSGSTLTFKDFKSIDAFSSEAGLAVTKKSLTIVLEGENKIVSSYSPALYSMQKVTIKGEGSLELTSGTVGAVELINPESSWPEIVLEGSPKVSISGQTFGVNAQNQNWRSVVLDYRDCGEETSVKIYGKVQPVRGMYVYLNEFGEESGAFWSDKQKGYALDGVKVADATLSFKRVDYEVGSFCGVYINNFTANHLSHVDGLTSGSAVYDHATQTLTLNNAVVEYDNQPVFLYKDMTILCKGNNKITTTSDDHISRGSITVSANRGAEQLTIKGKLEINTASAGIVIDGENQKVVLQDADLTIKAGMTAIRAQVPSSKDAFLEINRSKATFSPTNGTFQSGSFTFSAISYFSSVTLTDCEFKYPSGIAFNAEARELKVGDNVFTSEVVIEGNPASVDPTPEPDPDPEDGLQNISLQNIRIINRTIMIEDAVGRVSVFDATAKRIAEAMTPAAIHVGNTGMYILQTEEGAAKLLVR